MCILPLPFDVSCSIYKKVSKVSCQKQIALGLAFGSIIGGRKLECGFLHAVSSSGSECDAIRGSSTVLGGIILFTLNKESI